MKIGGKTLTNCMQQIAPDEKLTVAQLVKMCRAFYGTQRVIALFTRAPQYKHIFIYNASYPDIEVSLSDHNSQYYRKTHTSVVSAEHYN
jgi:hypothetical protein